MSDIHNQMHKPKKTKKVFIWVISILALILLAWTLAFGISSLLGIFNKNSGSPFINLLSRVTKKSSTEKLKGEDEGRVNILLLGMPGEGHEGPTLTDTMIVLSLKPAENKAAMLSVPRDMYVKMPQSVSYVKINSIYTFGDQKTQQKSSSKNSNAKIFTADNQELNNGFDYIRQAISDVTGLPIHYYIKMDFTGFEKIIDELGGVDIYVEKDLYDPYYPTDNFRYQTFKISKGMHHMDGATALKYARSRETSSDFDRAKRQQQILEAVKEKALKLSIFDAKKIVNLVKIIEANFKTDLSFGEINRLAEIVKTLQQDQIISRVLDSSATGALKATNYNGAFALIPKLGMGNYTEIQRIAKNIFEEGLLNQEAAKIEVQNGTNQVGLATSAGKVLESCGLIIANVTNSTIKYPETQIIDYTSGHKPATLKMIKSKIGGKVSKKSPPEGSKIDILVILGDDYQAKAAGATKEN